jgi:hypothetical protein
MISIARFILSSFKRATLLIDDLTPKLESAKATLGITDDRTFCRWIGEELAYLENIPNVPSTDLLKLEYIAMLKQLIQAE